MDQKDADPPHGPIAERDAIRLLLHLVGEDSKREGLKETPSRYVKALRYMTSGYEVDPGSVLKLFEDGAPGSDPGMVVQTCIPVYSLCEHHMLPFFGVAHIGYIPEGKIVGLSKLVRLVNVFARRLQVQERLGCQIADALMAHAKPKGVGVVLECRHLCMEARGVQIAGTITRTDALRGVFLDLPAARAEFMALAKRDRPL